MNAVNWKLGAAESAALREAVGRYVEVAKSMGVDVTNSVRVGVAMDLTECHLNGCPLDFDKMMTMGELDLAHDVGGIAQHLDRNTGKLKDGFVPRCAMDRAGGAR